MKTKSIKVIKAANAKALKYIRERMALCYTRQIKTKP